MGHWVPANPWPATACRQPPPLACPTPLPAPPPLPPLQFVLENLLGEERFGGLDLFMAGDDVKAKKPDPTIYK